MKALFLALFGRFLSFHTRWRLEGGICDVEVEDVCTWDAPDFSDAFIACAAWRTSGVALTEDECASIDSGIVYEYVLEHIY